MTLCAWLGGMYHPMSAQADQRIEEVKNLFLNKDLGVWINQYIGDNNLGHKIILTLGNDQREWKGFIQNMNTGEKLTLEGKYHRQDLKCILSDTSGKKWGQMVGMYKDSILQSEVMKQDKSSGYLLQLKQTPRTTMINSECPPGLSYREFRTADNNYFLHLQCYEDARVSGYIGCIKDSTLFWFKGNCKDVNCNWIELNVRQCNQASKFNAELKFEKQGQFKLITDSIMFPNNLIFNLANAVNFTCSNLTQDRTSANMKKIALEDKGFNKWLTIITQSWLTKVFTEVSAPEENHKVYSFGVQLDWVNEYFISGTLQIRWPGQKGIQFSPLNFNRRNGDEISLGDIFDKDEQFENILHGFLEETKNQYLEVNNEKLNHFILLDPFSNWTLLPTGICFSTQRNPVWGEYKIFLPYSKVQDKLRRSGPLKRIW
ncbi:MAG: hypothetical protein IPN15_19545 [Saprospiraceae bacterium]|nr:hypothetical protein [Candidatus Vicinibacter affinis]